MSIDYKRLAKKLVDIEASEIIQITKIEDDRKGGILFAWKDSSTRENDTEWFPKLFVHNIEELDDGTVIISVEKWKAKERGFI